MTSNTMRPNTPLELTPLRIEQDRAILKVAISWTAFPLYRGRAAQCRPFGGDSCHSSCCLWLCFHFAGILHRF